MIAKSADTARLLTDRLFEPDIATLEAGQAARGPGPTPPGLGLGQADLLPLTDRAATSAQSTYCARFGSPSRFAGVV